MPRAAKRGRTASTAPESPPAPAKRGRKPAPAKAAATRASREKETEMRMTVMESTLAAILERLTVQGTPAAAHGAASAAQPLPEAPLHSSGLPAQARAAHTRVQVPEDARSALPERVMDLELDPAHSAVQPLPDAPLPSAGRPARARAAHTRQASKDARSALLERVRDLELRPAHSLTDDSSTEEEDTYKPRRRGKFISGRVRTADIAQPKVHQLWPHEQGLYNKQGRAQAYDDLTLAQFVQGYLATVKKAPSGERQPRLDHLQALMADTSRFTWPQVRDFHAVFLQQVEQGNMSWTGRKGDVRDLKMDHLYLQTSSESSHSPKPDTSAPTRTAPARGQSTAAPKVQATTTCCAAYNTAEGCSTGSSHRGARHSCAHCFQVLGYHYGHPRSTCRRAAADGVSN